MNHAMGGEQATDYVNALTACQSMADVRALVEDYRELALDAADAVQTLTEKDWPEFSKGLRLERKGRFAGDAWAKRFAAILMPLPMMRISDIAHQYVVPFGVAWARCKQLRPDLLTVRGHHVDEASPNTPGE